MLLGAQQGHGRPPVRLLMKNNCTGGGGWGTKEIFIFECLCFSVVI